MNRSTHAAPIQTTRKRDGETVAEEEVSAASSSTCAKCEKLEGALVKMKMQRCLEDDVLSNMFHTMKTARMGS